MNILKTTEDVRKAIITQDRANTLAVLTKALELKKQPEVHLEGCSGFCEQDSCDYNYIVTENQTLTEVQALLQETLGEGKEINSIFKE